MQLSRQCLLDGAPLCFGSIAQRAQMKTDLEHPQMGRLCGFSAGSAQADLQQWFFE